LEDDNRNLALSLKKALMDLERRGGPNEVRNHY
jgi:hypothetical protein